MRRLTDTTRKKFQSTPSGWRVTYQVVYNYLVNNISIHTLRVEGDPCLFDFCSKVDLFQSTPSGWRVTPLLPCECSSRLPISIHTLRVEGDRAYGCNPRQPTKFQSTPSGWRVTTTIRNSINNNNNFNPHPPGGG